jgi:hypothetical protein
MFAEDFDSVLAIAANMFTIDGPYRLVDVANSQSGAIFHNDFRRTLNCLLLKVACNLAFSQNYKAYLI